MTAPEPLTPHEVRVRRVLNDPGAVLERYRGYGVQGDEYESLANWQVRALRSEGLLAPDPLEVARRRQEQAQRRMADAENILTRTTALVTSLEAPRA